MPVPCCSGARPGPCGFCISAGPGSLATSSSGPVRGLAARSPVPGHRVGFNLCVGCGAAAGRPRGRTRSAASFRFSCFSVALFICSCPPCLALKTRPLGVARPASPVRTPPPQDAPPQTRETHVRSAVLSLRWRSGLSHSRVCVLEAVFTRQLPGLCPLGHSSIFRALAG